MVTNYERYRQAEFNRPEHYPLNQSVNLEIYRPIASWMGRLILPLKEERESGVQFEVHHADPKYEELVGQVVYLKWIDDPKAKISVQSLKKDVNFTKEALDNYKKGKIEPIRVNDWRQVTPLESLAGSRPNDDVIVMLHKPMVVDEHGNIPHPLKPSHKAVTLYITSEPVQISGRFYGLVKFLQPIQPGSEEFRVVHFNGASGQFDGVEEVVRLPQVIPFERVIYPSISDGIEKSPLNADGWYIYGAKDADEMFVVQALAPRALLRLQPEEVLFGKKAAIKYLRKSCWQDIIKHKGQIQSVLLSMKDMDSKKAVSRWHEGDRALLVHLYGGIGGKKREAAAKFPIYFGHFAYGEAQVVREPLTGELRFDIKYHQVYCHNDDALIAGTLSWIRYMGDRQFGWLGIRPVSDILIKLDAFTEDYEINGVKHSPLRVLIHQLEIMTARYRIGDGTGATYIGPANNCAQDSNQALYAAIRGIHVPIQSDPQFKNWLLRHPELATCFKHLGNLATALRHQLLPFGVARADWRNSTPDLGSSLDNGLLKQIFTGLVTWRTMLPHKASDTVTQIFIEQEASLWILSTSQVGNSDPDIAAIAPFTF
ncbi:MAG: CPBP family intramembrane metalloprotease domain-containing protein [Stigonema ocellatum SAG 48.90 = DSM 106950]|nr:CPBP family intramembrane metalloprotease domain-containing protein [Stigonema ocellatum SAG 48.90 = DSM 106950]